MDVRKLLEEVKRGDTSIEEAENAFKNLPYEDLGYAKLDLHRKLRSGFPETVFCQGKPDAYLADIFETLYRENGEVLGTRATQEQWNLVRAHPGDRIRSGFKNFAGEKIIGDTAEAGRAGGSLHRRNRGYPGCGGSCQNGRIFRLPRGALL